MSSAGKLVMFAVLLTLITLVSGECEEKCHCSKYKVFCSLARLGALPTRIPNTTELVKIELDDIPRISSIVGLENITHLQIDNVNLNMIEPGAFQNVSRLQYLSITRNIIAFGLETDSFKYLDELYFLNLSGNTILALSPGTFSGLQNLRILDLSGNYIGKFEANAFQGMKYREINAVEYGNLFRHSAIEPTAFKYLSTLTYFDLTYHNPNHIPEHVSFGAGISGDSGTQYVNRNNQTAISELSYLQLSYILLENLKEIKFQNFTKLKYLDLSHNFVSEIKRGDFEGLVSLKTLIMKGNNISRLNKGTFHELPSLQILDVSACGISTIESSAFQGLFKLQILDLSNNKFDTLLKSTFSALPMLKEIIMEGNTITHIDSRCFGDFSNLKSLLNSARSVFEIEHLKSINTVNEKAFVQLQRLDNLRLFLHITIPKEIQVLNALHLNINGAYDDPQKELRRVLQTVRYVRSLSVTLLHVNSTQIFTILSEFHISHLTMSFSNSVFLNSKDLCCLLTLNSLTVYVRQNITIEDGAFRALKELKQLTLYCEFSFTISYGLFLGLKNLRLLNIKCQHCNGYFSGQWNKIQENIKYIDSGVFLGLDYLTELVLRRYDFTNLRPGAFQGLNKIEKIDLSINRIGKIEPGVFGAICKDEFETSCKNVTLPEYCNDTNALKTLKYLNLNHNNISHIHHHAFISCTNLQILGLSYNRFLTLDIPFLYTPGLRKLYISYCSITNIPNETFACSPLLSEIDFRGNKRISKLSVSALLPLKHLQNIDLVQSNLSHDCHLHETWMWLRQHRVNYDLSPYKYKIMPFPRILGLFSESYYDNYKDIEAKLSNMACNGTMTNISVRQHRIIGTDDFAQLKRYIEPIVLINLLIAGLASNGFLLFVAIRHSELRTKQNACVIHLATVEFLSLVLNLPLCYWDVANIRWEFDETLCKIFIFTKDLGVAVTAFSTVALSVERFLVARTFQNLKKMSDSETHRTVWLLLTTWISGIVVSLPGYFFAVVEGRCLYCPPDNVDYLRIVWTFQLITYFLLPAFVITFLNFKTSLSLRASIRKIPGEIKDEKRAKNRTKVASLLLIIILIFIIGYLPIYLVRFLFAWSLVDLGDIFVPSFFSFCVFFINTVFNPISIFVMSSKFKSYALRYFPFLEN